MRAWKNKNKKSHPILRGICANPGTITGKIIIIQSPDKPLVVKFSNYILVARFTTPILATALYNAKGIILESGGLTAHGAIIAREFNIPCLVAARGATLLKNNMRVILDATKGKVYATK